jgi:flagellar protein FliJ
MPKTKFRLGTLLRLRENYRDELRSRLAQAIHAANLLSEQQQLVKQEFSQLHTCQRMALAGETANVNQLVDVQRHLLMLRTQEETMLKQSEILQAEIERRRLAVVEADRQVRILEKLRERKQLEIRQQQMRAEIKQFDEIASIYDRRSK